MNSSSTNVGATTAGSNISHDVGGGAGGGSLTNFGHNSKLFTQGGLAIAQSGQVHHTGFTPSNQGQNLFMSLSNNNNGKMMGGVGGGASTLL